MIVTALLMMSGSGGSSSALTRGGSAILSSGLRAASSGCSNYYLRGDALLRKFNIERFPFLVDKKGSPASERRRYMLQDAINTTAQAQRGRYPKWAPRDCTQATSSHADFKRHGFDAYEVALSLVGHGGPKTSKIGSFARPGYSYLHMPFSQLIDFLAQLHPDDRFIAYVMTEEAAPVHMYFDIDADLDKFPHLHGADEECMRVFMAALCEFFESCFHRQMDTSGLLLLQATSVSKLSWHLHIHTEAFRDIKQHGLFVKQFRDWLEQRQEQLDAESEAAPEDESDPAIAVRSSLPLCCFIAADSRSREGSWQHIVDHAPYKKHQNLRAPYNRKPGKTALRVRRHAWDEHGELRVLPELGDGPSWAPSAAAPSSAASEMAPREIDPEVLFRAHPSLAQPSRPGYVHLTLAPKRPDRKRQRSAHHDGGDEWDDGRDDERDSSNNNRLADTADVAQGSKNFNRKKKKAKHNGQDDDSERVALTGAEESAVKAALAPQLGTAVEFDELYRCIGTGVDGMAEIRGITTRGSSDCPSLRVLQPHRSSMKHRSNRLRFCLSMGLQRFHCFDEDCRGHEQTVRWPMDEVAMTLLIGQPDGDTHSSTMKAGAQQHRATSTHSGTAGTALYDRAPAVVPGASNSERTKHGTRSQPDEPDGMRSVRASQMSSTTAADSGPAATVWRWPAPALICSQAGSACRGGTSASTPPTRSNAPVQTAAAHRTALGHHGASTMTPPVTVAPTRIDLPTAAVPDLSVRGLGLYEGWVDDSSSSRARLRQLDEEAHWREEQARQREEADRLSARQLYDQQVAEAASETEENGYEQEGKEAEAVSPLRPNQTKEPHSKHPVAASRRPNFPFRHAGNQRHPHSLAAQNATNSSDHVDAFVETGCHTEASDDMELHLQIQDELKQQLPGSSRT